MDIHLEASPHEKTVTLISQNSKERDLLVDIFNNECKTQAVRATFGLHILGDVEGVKLTFHLQ